MKVWVLCLLPLSAAAGTTAYDNLTLEQAIHVALENNQSQQVSRASLDMAEAQYQQAMAAFRPRVGLEAGFQRQDQAPTFTFQGSVQTPSMVIPGVGTLPGQVVPIDMNAKLFDRDMSSATLKAGYPLYTGGKKKAVTGMARTGVAIAQEEQRKTTLEVVRDVNRYYDGVLLAGQVEQLASDTLERFQVLEELTDRLYQNASLKVKKTDYLRARTTTAMTRSMLEEARYAHVLAKEALGNSMGLPINSALNLAPESPLPPFNADLERLIADAMRLNPDKQRLELALQAADYKIDEAKSGFLPVIGLDASTYRYWNGYDAGLMNADNRSGWSLGLGMKWEVFDGGMTRAAVDGAHAARMKLVAARVLLDHGLALQIKNDVLRLQSARAQVADNLQAQGYAEENRKLNVRAYQEEMAETKDVIEAQVVETLASLSLYRAQHDLRDALADLDYQVGAALP